MARRRRHTKKVVAYENDDVATLHGLLHSSLKSAEIIVKQRRTPTIKESQSESSFYVLIVCRSGKFPP